MCGIVGYAGNKQAAPILLEGLSKLEYRGYDSAGICVYTENGLRVVKAKGRLQALKDKIAEGKAVWYEEIKKFYKIILLYKYYFHP